MRNNEPYKALVGSPGYATVSFDLPRQASIVSGLLVLDIATELQEGAVARLRFSVNGERRGDIILAAGQNKSQICIDVLPRDLLQGRLDVSLASVGEFPKYMCSPDWNGGLIIQIEPSSRIRIETLGPLTDISDRLRATGNPQQVIWPATPTNENDIDSLMTFAVSQRLLGVRTEFVPEETLGCKNAVSFSRAELASLPQIRPAGYSVTPTNTWPQFIALDNSNAEVHFFQHETTWRHAFDLRDTPNAEQPTALDLRMRIVGLHEEAKWLLTVTLNNTLLHSELFAGDILNIEREVPFPPELRAFANVLEIRIDSSETQNFMSCELGAPSTAQLLPETALLGGVPTDYRGISNFIAAMAGPVQLHVSNKITAVEASGITDFLAVTFGELATWLPAGEIDPDFPYIYVGIRSELRDHIEIVRNQFLHHDLWLVWPRRNELDQLSYDQVLLTSTSLLDLDSFVGPRINAIVAVPKDSSLSEVDLPGASNP